LSKQAWAMYYSVLFFSYWFGAQRFDRDGDGDFDPEDVLAYLEDPTRAEKNFEQTRTGKARAKQALKESAKRKADAKRAARQRILEEKQRARAEGRPWDPSWESEVSLEAIISAEVEGVAAESQVATNLIEKQVPPWFVIFECLTCLFLWLVFAIKQAVEGADMLSVTAGLDTLQEGFLDLRWASSDCADRRPEIWRWLTYQWTHVGLMHLMSNVFLLVLLGIPLEGLHGSLRITTIFNIGVLGGAGCYFVSDAHATVVGCSGGCYALLGWHWADLLMNWRQKKFRFPTLFVLAFLAVYDVLSYGLGLSGESKSYSAHVGGAICGLAIGVLLGKNLKEFAYERYIQVAFGALAVVLSIFVVIWLGISDGPINIFEAGAGESPWCWIRQVYSEQVNPAAWECIRCWSESCVQQWTSLGRVVTVDKALCDTKGYYYVEE